MRKLLFILFGFWSMMCFSQTKLIAFKSHSGTTSNFKKALDEDLFDVSDSNFGEAPQRRVKNAKLDSVIYISPEKAVMITSEYCSVEQMGEPSKYVFESVWNNGKDTVLQHPLFSRNHSLDSIKAVLKQEYYFKNNIDSVVFIGFDNKVKKYKKDKRKKQKSVSPIISKDTNFPTSILISVLILFLLSVAMYTTLKIHFFNSIQDV